MAQSKGRNLSVGIRGIGREARWAALGGAGATMWLTGLSGSGKSTIAAGLESLLVEMGINAYRLDGDDLRCGLNSDLGFSAADRRENVRRVGEVARILADSGTLVLASVISPYEAGRERCRSMHEKSGLSFLEVFVDAPIEVCEERDPKGLYAKARAGEITGFTGIDDPYEPPARPDLVLRPAEASVEECVSACMGLLGDRGLLPAGRRS